MSNRIKYIVCGLFDHVLVEILISIVIEWFEWFVSQCSGMFFTGGPGKPSPDGPGNPGNPLKPTSP